MMGSWTRERTSVEHTKYKFKKKITKTVQNKRLVNGIGSMLIFWFRSLYYDYVGYEQEKKLGKGW